MKMDAEDVFEEPKQEKKIRRRTKNLYKMIREQMEFYFSDSNLLRDRYLQQTIQDSPDGYIDINIFMKFNKIRALTKNPKDVANAMSSSKVVELNEDRTKLKRKLPVKQRSDVDDCTIYVERLPDEVDHDWLKAVFSKFGTVLYVGLPRFKQSGKLKGYSFIEFDTPEAAQKACQYFGAECGDELPEHCTTETENHNPREEPLPSQEEKLPKRKRKREKDEEEGSKRQKVELVEESAQSPDEELSTKEENTESSGKQKKKKHRKRDKHKKKVKAESEIGDVALRVMSKREWKKWKNKYLSLQKKVMTEIKHTLCLDNHSTENIENQKVKEKEKTDKNEKKEAIIEFQPGVIVKVETVTPVLEVSKFKEKVRELGGVAYVDVKKEDTIAYIRCLNKESAEKILENDSKEMLGRFTMITDKEEEVYWEKIKTDKQKKYSKNSKLKRRGKNKKLDKVDKLIQNKHIHFDD